MTRLFSLSLAALFVAACTTVVTDGSSGGGNGTSGGPGAQVDPVSTAKLAEGLTVSDVAIFQAVKVPLVKGGERVADENSPIIAGRPGVIRAYVTPGDAWEAKSVVAYLTLVNAAGKTTKEAKLNVSAASSDDKAGTTFDFPLKAEEVTDDLKYSITLALDGETTTDIVTPAESDARYPRTPAQEALGATKMADVLKIVIVPVQYSADGSGRLPDISDDQIETYRQTILSLYPVASVDIKVRAPYKWSSTIAGNGSGWDEVLNALVRLRATDKVADDVYYYGAFAPKSNFQQFCSQGCVTGLSGLASDASDARVRASVGVGFSGTSAANTAAHEIGHAHGRDHAPCGGADGPDPKYPYPQAKIGVWGYNILTSKFVNPGGAQTPHDMMSYCDPAWISDYNYGKLFERVMAVNSARGAQSWNANATQSFRLSSINGEGKVTVGERIELPAGTSGNQRTVTYRKPNGALVSEGARFFPYDHLPGGMLFIPEHADSTVIGVEGAHL